MRLAVNASGLAKGGVLALILRLWGFLCRQDLVKLHVWYSRLEVAEKTRIKILAIEFHPFIVGQPVWNWLNKCFFMR